MTNEDDAVDFATLPGVVGAMGGRVLVNASTEAPNRHLARIVRGERDAQHLLENLSHQDAALPDGQEAPNE